MTKRAVIDASVVLKWYLDDEEHCVQAQQLRDSIIVGSMEVVVPSLVIYEVNNALNVAANRGRLSPSDARAILRNVIAFALPAVDGTDVVAEAFDLAQLHKRSGYDAAYLALARLLSAPLYTGDRRLYQAVHAALPWVLWIGDYGQEPD